MHSNGPFAIRYPKGRGVVIDWQKPFKEIEIGRARKINEGNDIAVLSIGHVGNFVNEAIMRLEAENISVDHFDMRFVKPLDKECLHNVFKKHNYIITIEDGTIVGGFGSGVIEFMCENNYQANVKRLGIPDKFIGQGKQKELYKECGFDAESIFLAAKSMVKPRVFSNVS